MPLSSGLNMISLPLKPVKPFTARSLANEIGATVVIRYDESKSRFVGFATTSEGNGFDIEGGKGYIVNVSESRTVAFTGAAWTNEPPVEMAPPIQDSGAWAFMVSGKAINGDMNLADSNYSVTVKNLQTGTILTEAVDSNSGYFSVAWADLNRKAVVKTGDKLEITVMDSNGKLVSGPFIREITMDGIKNALINVYVKLGDIAIDKSVLLQNFPNPFNPETWIPYQLKDDSPISIQIYTIAGELVRKLDLGHKSAGIYANRDKAAYWDGKNESGEFVSSGVYFYTIKAGEFTSTRKMALMK
jgi:hypothetical protein